LRPCQQNRGDPIPRVLMHLTGGTSPGHRKKGNREESPIEREGSFNGGRKAGLSRNLKKSASRKGGEPTQKNPRSPSEKCSNVEKSNGRASSRKKNATAGRRGVFSTFHWGGVGRRVGEREGSFGLSKWSRGRKKGDSYTILPSHQ